MYNLEMYELVIPRNEFKLRQINSNLLFNKINVISCKITEKNEIRNK